MECLRKSFFCCESVCIGTEININIDAQKDLERLCKEVANDGVSLIMKHKESGKIVGVSFNKIQVNNNKKSHMVLICHSSNEVDYVTKPISPLNSFK
jgi:hypothetical protein